MESFVKTIFAKFSILDVHLWIFKFSRKTSEETGFQELFFKLLKASAMFSMAGKRAMKTVTTKLHQQKEGFFFHESSGV